MGISDKTLVVLAVILFFGLIVPQFFRRLKLPFVSSLILLGAVMGPNGFNYVQPDETMNMLGFLGAAFYMMLSGFEVESLHLRDSKKGFWMLLLVNSVIPFLVGMGITWLFDYSWPTVFFMGTVFISSSIMVVFSNVRNLNLDGTDLGNTTKSLAVLQDVISLLLIFMAFKYIEPHQRFPLPILLGLLISSVVILRMFLPEIVTYFFQRFESRSERHEAKSRLVIAVLLLVIVLYSALDVHPVIAAFLVGFTLSEMPNVNEVRQKLDTIGNSLFVPIFLFIIGVDINLKILLSLTTKNYLLLALVAGALLAKYFSGLLGARVAGYAKAEGHLIAVSSTVKLTVTLSAAYAALTLEIIDRELYTAIVLVSLLGLILNPPLMSLMSQRLKPETES